MSSNPVIEPLDGSLFGPDQPCYGCSPTHPHGFHLKYQRTDEGVQTTMMPGPLHQGPPGIMHGGLVSLVADETAAWALIAATGSFGFTTSFELKLRSPVRIGEELMAKAWVAKPGSRVVRVAVSLTQGERQCSSGELTFMLMDQSSAERMLGGPLPAAWLRFCRT